MSSRRIEGGGGLAGSRRGGLRTDLKYMAR
jgi:hypothetical protein